MDQHKTILVLTGFVVFLAVLVFVVKPIDEKNKQNK